MPGQESRESGPLFKFGAFQADSRTGELTKHGIRVRLQEKPFQVLTLLLEGGGEVVTRDDLKERLWGSDTFVDFDRGLNIAINKLRQALSDSAESPLYIETLPRRGYRFIAPISGNGQSALADVAVAATASPELVHQPSKRRSPWIWGSAAVFVVAIVLILVVFWHSLPFVNRRLDFAARDWVLVADFDNRTGQEHLGEALQFALEQDLRDSRVVNVASQDRIEDSLRLMKKPTDSRVDAKLGREVCLRDGGIHALLGGSVEHVGSQYVMDLDLIDPVRGRVVARSSRKAATEQELLADVESLSGWVRQNLGESPTNSWQNDQRVEAVTTPSWRAVELYSRARALDRQGQDAAAEVLLTQALQEDPNFASAHAWLGYLLGSNGRPEGEYLPHLERAFQLSANVSPHEQYMIRGIYYYFKNEPEKALAEHQAAYQLNPDDEFTLDGLATAYQEVGLAQGALLVMKHGADIRPLSADAQGLAARESLMISGDMTGAKEYVRRAEDLRKRGVLGQGAWLGLFPAFEAWYRNDSAQALAEVNRIISSPAAKFNGRRDRYAIFEADLYLGLGRIHDAERVLQSAVPAGARPWSGELFVALARNDTNAMRRELRAISGASKNQVYSPIEIMLLIQAGFFEEASKGIADRDKDHWAGEFKPALQGQLAFYRGNIAEAVPLLEKGNRSLLDHGDGTSPVGFLGVETLARGLESQGELERAAAVLEETSHLKGGACGLQTSMVFWLRDEYLRAHIYRKLGRQQDAEKVEAGLRAELANADPDFPILVELNRSKAIAAAFPLAPSSH